MKKHKRIDFVIAGQPKSGTTALSHFLSQHPNIFISVPKEPAYFATDFMEESDNFHGKALYFKARTPDEYDRHFRHAVKGQILGDASTCYTYSKKAAENIKRHNPNAKIIIMLRNPVDFMHSLHMQYVNETVENETNFKRALELEAMRKQGQFTPPRTRCPSYHYYKTRAHYYKQVKRYYDVFPKNQILVITNDEFKNNNREVFIKVCRFLETDHTFMPDFDEVHGSKKPRSVLLNRLVHMMWLKNILYGILGPTLYTKIHKQVNKLLLVKSGRVKLDPTLRRKLWLEFSSDVKKTSRLVGQDLYELWDEKT